MPKRPIRLGLLSPYNGTNLGDQAIYAACLENLRGSAVEVDSAGAARGVRRQAEAAGEPAAVEVIGICLNPAQVSRLHGIETFPVTGLPVPFYSTAAGLFGSLPEPALVAQPTAVLAAADVAAATPSTGGSLRELVKRIPGARSLAQRLRRARDSALRWPREAVWIWRSWKLLGTLDGVLVSGGGQIDEEWGGPWGHPYSLFRWALLTRLRSKRFLIASVGVCAAHRSLSRWFFRSALRNADYVSCRDAGSVELITRLTGRPTARFVPDLACGLTLPSTRDVAPRRIVVSPIAFGKSGAWPTEAQETYRRYLDELREFVLWLARSGYEVRIVTTSSPDFGTVTELAENLARQSPELARSVEIVKPPTVQALCQAMLDCSIVVASRLHGVMLAHLLGKPVLAISFDRKVDAHLEQFGQTDFRTDIRTVTAAELRGLFEKLVARQDAVREAVRQQRDRHRAAVIDQFVGILESVGKG